LGAKEQGLSVVLRHRAFKEDPRAQTLARAHTEKAGLGYSTQTIGTHWHCAMVIVFEEHIPGNMTANWLHAHITAYAAHGSLTSGKEGTHGLKFLKIAVTDRTILRVSYYTRTV
jgi:hypothetical protein